jgi:predicted ATPase
LFITRIILKNWKNFREVDVNLEKRVFIIGPNASGKSNFLDAFRFLRDIAKAGGGLQTAVNSRGGISKIRCLAARRAPDVEIEVYLSDKEDIQNTIWKYSIGIKQQPRGRRQVEITYEKVFKNDETVLKRPDREDRQDSLRLTQTHLEQINANKEFRQVAESLASIQYFHLIPQLLRRPEAFAGKPLEDDPFGHRFIEKIIKTNSNTRKARLRKIQNALTVAVPQLKELKDTKDERGIPHLEVVYKHWRAHGGKQNEEQLSDGTLRLIGFLWSLMDGDSLLLLEEPELSLHTSIIKILPSLMWRLQSDKRRQVIISTHSCELLSDKGIGAEEVLLLQPDVEGTKIKPISSIRQIKQLIENGMSVGDAAIPMTEPKDVNQLIMFDE